MDEKITKIKEGIVIDHIKTGKGGDVVNILGLDSDSHVSYTLGIKYVSNKLGKKDVLKVEGGGLDEEKLNKIALISPNATISRISNYNILSKRKVELPNVVEDIVSCFNPNCITRYENVRTKFSVVSKNPLILRCHYCEKSSSKIDLI